MKTLLTAICDDISCSFELFPLFFNAHTHVYIVFFCKDNHWSSSLLKVRTASHVFSNKVSLLIEKMCRCESGTDWKYTKYKTLFSWYDCGTQLLSTRVTFWCTIFEYDVYRTIYNVHHMTPGSCVFRWLKMSVNKLLNGKKEAMCRRVTPYPLGQPGRRKTRPGTRSGGHETETRNLNLYITDKSSHARGRETGRAAVSLYPAWWSGSTVEEEVHSTAPRTVSRGQRGTTPCDPFIVPVLLFKVAERKRKQEEECVNWKSHCSAR